MRTKIYGIRKSELKNQKEYTYHEACNSLGACARVTLKVWGQEQEWHDKQVVSDVYWEGGYSYPVENEIPEGWYNVGEKYLIEKYDVWENTNGDFLLATPIPKS